MTSTQVSDEPVKTRILLYCSEKFFEEGFAKISMDEIAANLGMSKKTLYKFFQGKEELVVQIMERTMGEGALRVRTIIESKDSFIEKVNSLMIFLGQLTCKFGKQFQQDIQRHIPDLWRRVEEFRGQMLLTNLARLLQQGLEEGSVRQGVNPTMFLLAYRASLDAVVTPAVLINQPFSAPEAIQGIMSIFFHGVLTNEASAKLMQLRQSLHSQPV